MPEENEDIKFKEDLLEIIPNSLLNILNAENISYQIAEICFENGVKEEDVENVGYGVSLVLLGELRPNDLPVFLEKNFKINNDAAQKIYKKINEVVFSPVKDELLKLYELKPAEAEKPTQIETTETEEEKTTEMPKRPLGKDSYREKIE